MSSAKVIAVLIGEPVPFGPKQVPSAIQKTPVASAYVGSTGLAGDVQGDPSKHGGPEKAVHQYPYEHYEYWKAHGVASPLLAAPGGFGENLTTLGMTEESACVGDIYRVGSNGPVLQITQTRQPCWKLGVRFGIPALPADIQRAGRTGWHYRVLTEGTLSTGAAFELVDRPHRAWPLSRLLRALYVDSLDMAALHELLDVAALAESFKALARRRIETASVEPWQTRLQGREAVV